MTTINVTVSTVNPSFVLFAPAGYMAKEDFQNYLATVKPGAKFSPLEKGFLVAKAKAPFTVKALEYEGYPLDVQKGTVPSSSVYDSYNKPCGCFTANCSPGSVMAVGPCSRKACTAPAAVAARTTRAAYIAQYCGEEDEGNAAEARNAEDEIRWSEQYRPMPGTAASVARFMYESGAMSGEQADALKEELKDRMMGL